MQPFVLNRHGGSSSRPMSPEHLTVTAAGQTLGIRRGPGGRVSRRKTTTPCASDGATGDSGMAPTASNGWSARLFGRVRLLWHPHRMNASDG
jgi:hypothetical protein